MNNKAYIKGVRKERKIINEARKLGYTAARSAGSHSRIDCWILDTKLKRAYLYQCKPDSMSESAKQKIEFACADIPGSYEVFFEVV